MNIRESNKSLNEILELVLVSLNLNDQLEIET